MIENGVSPEFFGVGDVARRLRAVLGAIGREVERRGHRGADEHERGEQRHRVAHAQRQAPARARRQRADDRGRLAGGLARARRLDGQHVLEVGDQLAVGAVAAVEVLGRGAVDDGGQRAGDLRAAQLHVGQLLAHVLHRHRDLVLAVEGDVAREHLEEHDAQRVEVALRVDVLAQRLLGRDVVGRAQHAAVGGQPLLGRASARSRSR